MIINIFSGKNCELPLKASFTAKIDFLRCVSVCVFLSAYKQLDYFSNQDNRSALSQRAKHVLCFVTFCIRFTIVEIFYTKCTENLVSSVLSFRTMAYTLTCWLYQRRQCTVAANYGQRNTRIQIRIGGSINESEH